MLLSVQSHSAYGQPYFLWLFGIFPEGYCEFPGECCPWVDQASLVWDWNKFGLLGTPREQSQVGLSPGVRTTWKCRRKVRWHILSRATTLWFVSFDLLSTLASFMLDEGCGYSIGLYQWFKAYSTHSCSNLQFFFRTNIYSIERFSHGVTASCLYFTYSYHSSPV